MIHIRDLALSSESFRQHNSNIPLLVETIDDIFSLQIIRLELLERGDLSLLLKICALTKRAHKVLRNEFDDFVCDCILSMISNREFLSNPYLTSEYLQKHRTTKFYDRIIDYCGKINFRADTMSYVFQLLRCLPSNKQVFQLCKNIINFKCDLIENCFQNYRFTDKTDLEYSFDIFEFVMDHRKRKDFGFIQLYADLQKLFPIKSRKYENKVVDIFLDIRKYNIKHHAAIYWSIVSRFTQKNIKMFKQAFYCDLQTVLFDCMQDDNLGPTCLQLATDSN